jgi:ATP-dependent DNA ligase
MLQNYGSAAAPLHFFVFDLLVSTGKAVMGEPLMQPAHAAGKARTTEIIRAGPIFT